MFLKISFLFLTIFCCQFSFSQIEVTPTADSSVVIKKKKKKRASIDYSYLDPKKATIFALLPGLGQAYNKRYWKIPIIYGLGTYTVYSAVSAHKQYKYYSYSLDELNASGEGTILVEVDNKGTMAELSESQINQEKDIYKRQRDFNFILTLAIYGLQIVDASVDAHLLKFHNSENFLSLAPTVINHRENFSPGLSLSLNLR